MNTHYTAPNTDKIVHYTICQIMSAIQFGTLAHTESTTVVKSCDYSSIVG